jgi:hypothetical protein
LWKGERLSRLRVESRKVYMLRTFRAVKFLIMGPVILAALCIINLMASPGHWWVQWAALGIGLAWVASLLRVLRALVLVGGLAALVAALRKTRYWPNS